MPKFYQKRLTETNSECEAQSDPKHIPKSLMSRLVIKRIFRIFTTGGDSSVGTVMGVQAEGREYKSCASQKNSNDLNIVCSKKNKEPKSQNKASQSEYRMYPNTSFKHSTEIPNLRNLIPSIENQNFNYCSFFNNRAPSPQINLKNCTWYKENSCCLQREIESTFSKVKPLIGSSVKCQKYLNNLMCYICAPNQFKFYGKERLTVCREYCDEMYDACGDAILKGAKIKEIYDNGEKFCESRRYNIDVLDRDQCFYREINEFEINSVIFLIQSKILIFILALGVYFII
ncbi:unnamed protein product [Brachionus calyciflorus]|uniref:Folate receptor-like domain-containing protein n=1 Tax=Brachionus calyciflorus TaxID=104777 RepID=A0A813PJS0_9BILA|nr:unnamed protein product [Brachionus calyciflorus]